MKTPVILCVDDERFVLDSLRKSLNSSFEDKLIVKLAESAAEALDLLDELIHDGYEIPIVISDWLMPGMKGDEFLIQVHSILPKTRKIMLTGQATTEGVGNAINKAKLYRYISKPWEAEDLDLTVTEAFKSYYHKKKIEDQQKDLLKINTSLEIKVKERTIELDVKKKEVEEILNKALKGSVTVLLEIVAESNKKIFEKAIRVKDITKRIVIALGIESIWEFEMAALLSQIGCLYIDNNIVEKFLDEGIISKKEMNVYTLHPLKTYEVLKEIPYFENIAEGILNLFSENKYIGIPLESATQAVKISKILRIAHDFDQLITHGRNEVKTLAILMRHKSTYDEDVVDALNNLLYTTKSVNLFTNIQPLHASDLKVGMILAEKIKNIEGGIEFESDEEITADLLMKLVLIKKKNGISEPIYVYCKSLE